MEELRISLINAINESGLSIEAAVFVVRDVYRDINETFRRMKEEAEKLVKENHEESNNNRKNSRRGLLRYITYQRERGG